MVTKAILLTSNLGTDFDSGTVTANKINVKRATSSVYGLITLQQLADISSLNLTGGSVNGAPIGATDPSTGKFTSLEATGLTSLGGGLSLANPTVTIANNLDIDSGTLFINASLNQVYIGSTTGSGNGERLQVNGPALIHGMTVGLGGGNQPENSAVGKDALRVNTTGIRNTAFGFEVLKSCTGADSNTGVGASALAATTSGSLNTSVGRNSLASNLTGSNNVAVGVSALQLGTASAQNVALGSYALTAVNASANTAVGYQSQFSNSSGQHNVSVGQNSLYALTTGVSNVSVGTASLVSLTTGVTNTAIGHSAGSALTTGSYNVFVGGFTGVGAETLNNHIYISDGSGVRRIVVNSAGNVAIGSTSSTEKLGVNGNVLVEPGNSFHAFSNKYGVGTPDLSGLQIFAADADVIRFGHRSPALVFTERMRIDSNGLVGIGTNSPTAMLDVASDVVRVRSSKTPASASSSGNQGDICWDANYVYVCVATNTWKRSAISAW